MNSYFSLKRTLEVTVLFLLILCAAKPLGATATTLWKTVGTTGFSAGGVQTGGMGFDSNDTAYVGFEDLGVSGKATVMYYDDGEWALFGPRGFSDGAAWYSSFGVNTLGVPYMAYSDQSHSGKLVVQTWGGSSWTAIGNSSGITTSTASDIALTFDTSGRPYVAYKDASTSSRASVLHWDGDDWVHVGLPGISTSTASAIAIALDSTGHPYVAYQDGSQSDKLNLRYWDGQNWQVLGGTGVSSSTVTDISIAVDSLDNAYVAYADDGNGSKLTVRYYDWNAGLWSTIGDVGVSDGGVSSVSIKVDSHDVAYVSYKDGGNANKLSVQKWDGNSWEYVGGAGVSAGAVGITSLALDSSDVVHVFYADGSVSNKAVLTQFVEIPDEVTGLSLVGRTKNSITFSWNPVSVNPAVTAYVIERESPIGGGFSTLATVGSVTSYTDTGLTPQTEYNYRVTAQNLYGTGTSSTAFSARTAVEGGATSAPSIQPLGKVSDVSSDARIPLAFTVNNGASTITSPVTTISFSADPSTVRGYVISLDPLFADSSIIPYHGESQGSYTLPVNKAGSYTIYLKYYSTTGLYSDVLSHTLVYAPETVHGTVGQGTIQKFARTLRVGSVGVDVLSLQKFLNAHGFSVAVSGVGSAGKETSYFGRLTQLAVKRFQEAYAAQILTPLGLANGTGLFGPATIAKVNEMVK